MRRNDRQREHDERRDGDHRPDRGPDLESHELSARAMLLDRHAQPCRAKDSAARMEVPTVEGVSPPHSGALLPHAALDRREPIFRCLPALAPYREMPWNRHVEAGDALPTPGRQAVRDAAVKSGQRLHEM